jgi:acyl carrier protein
MNDQEIIDQLNDIFRDLFENEEISVTHETTADDVLGWDSLNHIGLVVAVQSRFGIKFKTVEIEQLHNVGDMIDLIARKSA